MSVSGLCVPHGRPWTTWLPLCIVLGVAIIKEAVEDYKRFKQDVEVNARAVKVQAVGGIEEGRARRPAACRFPGPRWQEPCD